VATASNEQVWAERYDRRLVDVFALQDEVTRNIVSTLALQLTAEEEANLGQSGTHNFAAYEAFLQGQRLSRQTTRESNELARLEYQKALELDPKHARSYGAIAYSLAQDYRRGWSDNPVESIDRALLMALKAVELGKDIPQTHWALGYVHLMRREYEEARKSVEQAIRIAPNYADGYGLLALINNSLGQPERALENIQAGMRLNPFYTWDYPYNQGRAYYQLGRYEEAVAILEQAQTRNENAEPIKLWLVASYIRNGQPDDAEWAAEELLILNPAATLSHTAKTIPIPDPHQRSAFIDDLRQAGIPE
jgi:tetratricopeptide (TPR) repeat protein